MGYSLFLPGYSLFYLRLFPVSPGYSLLFSDIPGYSSLFLPVYPGYSLFSIIPGYSLFSELFPVIPVTPWFIGGFEQLFPGYSRLFSDDPEIHPRSNPGKSPIKPQER